MSGEQPIGMETALPHEMERRRKKCREGSDPILTLLSTELLPTLQPRIQQAKGVH